MHLHSSAVRLLSLVAGIAALTIGGWANADPPSLVGRLGHVRGDVSFSPAGDDDWFEASINRPITTGDRLWSDNDSRAELQLGGALVRMSEQTGLGILDLDDRNAQVQLTQGRLNVRVRRIDRNQGLEIDTPNLAFTVREPADYRIEVDPDGQSTTIAVRRGRGEAYGRGAAYIVDAPYTYRFYGSDLRDYEYLDAVRFDDFDRWSSDLDRRYDNSMSARYVSPYVVGYEDLDEYGYWRRDNTYGDVWFPSRVSSNWAPYTDGHWAWIDPWGWTWVDNAPWGFPVSHYGRWANLQGHWGWIPGPMQTRAYYAPALVAFLVGSDLRQANSSVAWFPLGPREVYRPSYQVSRGYFENLNRSNTVINQTVINNYYGNARPQNVVYVNRRVPGAVVAVPRTAFMQSQPVTRVAIKVEPNSANEAAVESAPPVTPTKQSVRGSGVGRNKPPARVFERPIVARTTPPPAPAGFAAQQAQLASHPGKPLDDEARKHVKPESATPAPVVKVVAPTVAATPTERPPASSQRKGQHGPPNERDRSAGQREDSAAPQTTATPTARVNEPAPANEAPAAPRPARTVPATESGAVAEGDQPQQQEAAPPPDKQHGKSAQHRRPDEHGAAPSTAVPAEPPSAAQPESVPAVATPKQATPPPAAAAAQPPNQHGKYAQQHGRPDQNGQQHATTPKSATPPPPADATAAPAAEGPGSAPDTKKGKAKKKKGDAEEPVPEPAPEDASTPTG
jgi:hypothetical protein